MAFAFFNSRLVGFEKLNVEIVETSPEQVLGVEVFRAARPTSPESELLRRIAMKKDQTTRTCGCFHALEHVVPQIRSGELNEHGNDDIILVSGPIIVRSILDAESDRHTARFG